MITLFGATGYTGRLVARALDATGRPFRLAGRDATRLAELAASLPSRPAWLTADVARPATLDPLAAGTTVLVNCAGPFTDLGLPVASLAARAGLRYLDTTNELGFVHQVATRLDQAARTSGATLVPACGFEVAPADCLAALLASEPGYPAESVHVTYRLSGFSSRGTRRSVLRTLATSRLGFRDGRFVPVQTGSMVRVAQLNGRACMTINIPSSETVTVPRHLPVRDVGTWLVVSRRLARLAPVLLPLVTVLLRTPPGRRLPTLVAQPAPPPDDQRGRHGFDILVQVRAAGRQVQRQLSGADPYGLTAALVAYAASRLLEADVPAGVQPPARVLDPQAVVAMVAEAGGVSA